MCHKNFRAIVFMYRAKNDNSELGIHLRTNSEISENSELSLWPLGNLVCFHMETTIRTCIIPIYFTQATSVHGYNTHFATGENLVLHNVNTTHYMGFDP